jgi:hypothetical protein
VSFRPYTNYAQILRVMGREIDDMFRWEIIFCLLRVVERGDIGRVMTCVDRYGRQVLVETIPFVDKRARVWTAVNAVCL